MIAVNSFLVRKSRIWGRNPMVLLQSHNSQLVERHSSPQNANIFNSLFSLATSWLSTILRGESVFRMSCGTATNIPREDHFFFGTPSLIKVWALLFTQAALYWDGWWSRDVESLEN